MLADHQPRGHRPLIVELSSSSRTLDDEDSLGQHGQEEQEATYEAQHGFAAVPALHGARQTQAAVHAALAAQHAVPAPQASVFADISASPDTRATAAAVQQCGAVAAAALRERATSLSALAPTDIDYGVEPASALATETASPPPDAKRRGLRQGVLIEEVPEEAPPSSKSQRLSAAELVLLCSLHAQDDALAGAWVTAEASAAASAVLECLASMQPRKGAGQGGASANVEQHGSSAGTRPAARHRDERLSAAGQQLILRVMPDVLRLLRPILGNPRELRRQAQGPTHVSPIHFNEGELLVYNAFAAIWHS